jgi:hypothetical protein
MSPPSPILASEFHVRRAGKRNSAFLPRFDLPYIPRLFCGLPFVTATGIMRNAASSPFGSQRSVTKGRPVVPICPVELVESILTPPGPMPVEQHVGIFGAIVTTRRWQRVGMSVVLRQQT